MTQFHRGMAGWHEAKQHVILYSEVKIMSDGREEREEREKRREQEERENREDRIDHYLPDPWKPERPES